MVEPLIIKRVKLENFLSHRNTEITLDRGVSVFIGPNGAGKSSIFEAIYYALTGKGWRASIGNLVNKNASSAMVEVEFIYGGDTYVVRRRIGAPGTVLLKNGVMIARDKHGVDQALEEILGVSSEKIENLVLIKQGGITRLFIDKKPKERKELIDAILGIHEYSDAFEKMKDLKIRVQTKRFTIELAPYVDSRGSSLSKTISSIQKMVNDQYSSILEEIEELKREVEERSRELDKLKKIVEEEKLEERASRYDELNKKLSSIEANIESLNNRVNEYLKELEDKKNVLNELRDRLRAVEKELEDLSDKVKILDIEGDIEKLYELYIKLKSIDDQLLHIMERFKEFDEKRREIDELVSRYGSLSVKKLEEEKERLSRELKKFLDERERLSNEKTRFKTELMNIERSINELRGQLDNVIDTIKSIGYQPPSDYGELAQFLEELYSRLNDMVNERENEREKLLEEKARIESLINDARDKIKLLMETREPKCPLCGGPLDDEHRERVIEKLKHEIEEGRKRIEYIDRELERLEEELGELRARIEKIPKSLVDSVRETYDRLNKYLVEKEELASRVKDVEAKLNSLEAMVNDLNRGIEEIEEKLKIAYRLEELKKVFDPVKYDELKEKIEGLEKEKDELGKEFSGLIDRVKSFLNLETSDHVEVVERSREKLEKARRYRDKYNELRNEKKSIEERIRDLEKEVEVIGERIASTRKDLEKLRVEKSGVEEELRRAEEAKKKLEEIKQEIIGIERDIENKTRIVENKEKELEEIKRDVEEINRAIRRVYVLKWIRENLFNTDGVPKLLRSKYIKLLSALIEDLMNRFNLEYHSVEVDEDYGINLKSINYPGKEVDVKGLSGGEQVAVCLVAILALHKLVVGGKLGFLALDEPTAHLDADRRIELIELLKEFQGGRMIPQLLIVTHDENVREAGDRIYRVSKVNGYSRVEELGESG